MNLYLAEDKTCWNLVLQGLASLLIERYSLSWKLGPLVGENLMGSYVDPYMAGCKAFWKLGPYLAGDKA